MKIKQAIAQLCLKQEALCRMEYKNQKHKEVQEVMQRHAAAMGTYAKPLAAVLSVLVGAEIVCEPPKLYEMFSAVADPNGVESIVLGIGNGSAYSLLVPATGDALMPGTYIQVNNSFRILCGEERQKVVNRFLANKWKDEQVVDWVYTKLAGQHMTNFIKLTFEAAETL